MKNFRTVLVALFALLLIQGVAWAQDAEPEGADKYKTRRTPTMREAVYKKIAEAQELAEAEDFAGAAALIEDLGEMRNLNSYELAQMYNFRAFLAYNREDYPGAIQAYEQLLAQPDLPEALETSSLYSLGQLYFSEENYPKSIEYLEKWFAVVANPQPQAYILLGQVYLLVKEYNKALQPLLTAIDKRKETDGDEVPENWYLILRSCYYELGDFKAVVQVQEELIRINPKKQYWVELSGFYSELEKTSEQLHALDLAYRQKLLDRGNEYLTLGQLFMQAEIPHRGARILQEGMDKGLIEDNVSNLRLLSQAYMMAQEFEAALKPLRAAAKLSDDGELYHHLATSLMNLERFEEAAVAAESALAKGDLKRDDQVYILLGMARYNAGATDSAIQAFQRARRDSRSAAAANQWLNYIETEQERLAQLDSF